MRIDGKRKVISPLGIGGNMQNLNGVFYSYGIGPQCRKYDLFFAEHGVSLERSRVARVEC